MAGKRFKGPGRLSRRLEKIPDDLRKLPAI